MTKNEAKDTGHNRGTAYANLFERADLLTGLDESTETIKARARQEAMSNGFKSVDSPNAVAFIESFERAARSRFNERRYELPEVKASGTGSLDVAVP